MEVTTCLQNRVHKQFHALISMCEIMHEGVGENNGYSPGTIYYAPYDQF